MSKYNVSACVLVCVCKYVYMDVYVFMYMYIRIYQNMEVCIYIVCINVRGDITCNKK